MLVTGCGLATLDFLGQVARMPELDGKVDLAAFSLQGGGPVATALVTAARFGAEARFVGKLADDQFGKMVLAELAESGIDVRFVIHGGTISPLSFVAVDGAGRRTIFHNPGVGTKMTAAEWPTAALADADLLLVDGHQMEAQIAAAEQASASETPVLLDAGSLREGMGELFSLATAAVVSERFAAEVAPRGELEDMLIDLQRMGPRKVVITLGDGGSVGIDGDKVVRQLAHEVEVVDTTGAGDVYHGAFAFALCRRWPLERAMQLASAAAGLSCRALGGRGAIPSLEESLEAAGLRDTL
jgi:sugar/nucleoside kinase (ribokinase family)